MSRQLSKTEATIAVLSWPSLHDIASQISTARVGRPRQHPIALHLAWGALARLHGSGNRLDIETADRETWRQLLEIYNQTARAHPLGVTVDVNCERLTSHTYRHVRDNLCSDENLEAFSRAFTIHSIIQAQALGLIRADGRGSLTHPSPERVIYGDGTVVRPIYKNRELNGKRIDLDAGEYTRHDGKIVGNNIVFVATRGTQRHRRLILAVGRADGPGQEAAKATALIQNVLTEANGGIQAVVYDGAFRGSHHQILMDGHGIVVVNKVHPESHKDNERTYRKVPLGTWTHTVGKRGGRDCEHQLVVHNGDIHDAVLTDDGTITLSPPLQRTQIRRHQRANKTWRLNLGVTIRCRHGSFTAWINPHPQPADPGPGRTDQIRLIPPSCPDFAVIYGLRNDAEAINAEFKRTLVADRAPALGWRRQVLAAMSWAILNNSRAWWLHSGASRNAANNKAP
ncbi:MAG: hypothetical protein WBA45_08270 [Microthrixaceae bacterium]